ncbi:MAG: DUF6485 family protein [Planctomycetes bacterium]|nr:DUF6485 family protein [Planctomycetota bacterium]
MSTHCGNADKNDKRCTCSYTSCPRHGVCCGCVAYHLKDKQLPQCYVEAGVK